MKKLIPGFIIAFVSGFMLFFYEPINMYATNMNDFWFDFGIMIKPTLVLFLGYFLCISIVYTLIYLINNTISKKLYIYKFAVIVGFILLFALYIQGNFLIGGLPILDGTTIVWENYRGEMTTSLITWIVITLVIAIVTLKFKFEKTSKIYSFISLSIFVMITTSMISTFATENVFKSKERIVIPTVENINKASNNKNFFIFLLDAADSKVFNEELEKTNKIHILDDFTYYPDLMSGYSLTRDSIPFIFSGIWNENKTDFDEYFNMAMDNSKLIDKLIEEKYSINLYEDELVWYSDKALNLDNINFSTDIKYMSYYRNLLKYIAFKYLPFQLKKYSMIDTMTFSNCKVEGDYTNFYWRNYICLDNLEENLELEKIDQNYFNFLHIEGAHVPFNVDSELNYKENGTYEDKIQACIMMLEKYLDRLKNNDVYDNSVIIIMADHGYNYEKDVGKQNPILYIKGIDEHHELKTSDIPISQEDFSEAYLQLLDGAKSEDLFQNVDKNRKRRHLVYEYMNENHMVEYEQTGTADNEETLIPTGREFNR